MLKNSKALMKVIKITDRLLFSIHDQEGVKLPLRLILKFSYLKKQKFSHKCKILWALCVGAYQKILSWSNLELFNSLYGIDIKINKYKEDAAITVLISFALDKYHSNGNRKILFYKIKILYSLKCLITTYITQHVTKASQQLYKGFIGTKHWFTVQCFARRVYGWSCCCMKVSFWCILLIFVVFPKIQ